MSHVSSRDVEELSDAERAFYSRQLILPEMGYEAQLALKGARVVVLGAGGLGAPSLPVSYTHLDVYKRQPYRSVPPHPVPTFNHYLWDTHSHSPPSPPTPHESMSCLLYTSRCV